MQLKVKKCCFCCSLRWGIILFGYINIIFSTIAISCLVVTTELQKAATKNSSLEVVTATVLFGIFGMGVILNVLLLFAGYQKDISMLRLYICYAVPTTMAALVPTVILLTQLQIIEVCAAVLAIAIQAYVIVLVRSEIIKLKQKIVRSDESATSTDATVNIPESENLI